MIPIELKPDASYDLLRIGADNYSREVLFALEERVSETLAQVRGGIDMLDNRDSALPDKS